MIPKTQDVPRTPVIRAGLVIFFDRTCRDSAADLGKSLSPRRLNRPFPPGRRQRSGRGTTITGNSVTTRIGGGLASSAGTEASTRVADAHRVSTSASPLRAMATILSEPVTGPAPGSTFRTRAASTGTRRAAAAGDPRDPDRHRIRYNSSRQSQSAKGNRPRAPFGRDLERERDRRAGLQVQGTRSVDAERRSGTMPLQLQRHCEVAARRSDREAIGVFGSALTEPVGDRNDQLVRRPTPRPRAGCRVLAGSSPAARRPGSPRSSASAVG